MSVASMRASRTSEGSRHVPSAGVAGSLAIAAVLVYIGATVGGGLLDPGYSHIRQHVSDLTASGASTWAALVGPYLLYNVLAAAFAIALYRASTRSRLWQAGTILLIANAVAGVLMVTLFREDIGGVPTTSAGAGHLVFAGVSSLSILIAAFVYGVAFRRSSEWQALSSFSITAGLAFIVLGPAAAYATAQRSDLAGLAERGPIGLFLVWLVVVGAFAIRLGRRERHAAVHVA